MKSALSRRQQISILIVSLILHLFLLMTMFMAQLQQADFYTKPDFEHHEPLITIEDTDSNQTQPEHDWVAINTADSPLPNQLAALEQMQEPQEQTQHDMLSDNAIQEAIAMAQQILKSEKQNIVAPLEPISESKPSEIIIESTPEKFELKKTPSPKKFTFAQLTQGFANHLQEAAMSVQSNTQGTASVDQLKHLHYCQKIIGCLVTSYKINRDSAPHHKIMGAALIKLALNQDGSIHTLALAQSSGNQSMDRFLLHIFQDASSSFPPVPASFKEKPYPLPLFNIEHLEAFQSVNGWYINNTK